MSSSGRLHKVELSHPDFTGPDGHGDEAHAKGHERIVKMRRDTVTPPDHEAPRLPPPKVQAEGRRPTPKPAAHGTTGRGHSAGSSSERIVRHLEVGRTIRGNHEEDEPRA